MWIRNTAFLIVGVWGWRPNITGTTTASTAYQKQLFQFRQFLVFFLFLWVIFALRPDRTAVQINAYPEIQTVSVYKLTPFN